MGVHLSGPAEADLYVIYEYIFGESPQNAKAFLERFESAVALVERFPYANRVREELPVVGLRFARADPAVLVYRILDNGECEVLRVAHKAQRIAALFEYEVE
jgi:plasmid stabilization system protein ParE